jgi:hypothetical protein
MENKPASQSSSETEEFTCDICGKNFDSVSSLTAHKLRHSRPALGLKDEESQMRGDIGAAGLPTSAVS